MLGGCGGTMKRRSMILRRLIQRRALLEARKRRTHYARSHRGVAHGVLSMLGVPDPGSIFDLAPATVLAPAAPSYAETERPRLRSWLARLFRLFRRNA